MIRQQLRWAQALVLLLFAAAAVPGWQPWAAGVAAQRPPSPQAAALHSTAAMTADELILQFRRPELQAALRLAMPGTPPPQAVVRALDALGQRHGVSLRYIQTLGVGSALVALTPASTKLDALVARLAADAELESVEVNARMTTMRPGGR